MDEDILLRCDLGEVLGTEFVAADGTELGSSDGFFDGSNDGKPVGALLGDSLG